MPYIASADTSYRDISLQNDSMTVLSGGVADNIAVNDGGRMYVSKGGTANGAAVNCGGQVHVFGGAFKFKKGFANSATVNDGGRMYVSNGGVASGTTVNSGGQLHITSGPLMIDTYERDGLSLKGEVRSGGTAYDTTVNDGGSFFVSGGCSADNTTVNGNGRMEVANGGFANNTTLNNGGLFGVYGGTADNTMVSSGGRLIVSSGGTADNTMVSSGGRLIVSSNGTADNTTVSSGGRLIVSSDGTADNTTVNSGGILSVLSGGMVSAAAIRSGGKITGQFDCSGITFDPGAILDFDVSELAPGNAEALVNMKDLAVSQDMPTFTLTTAFRMEEGTYKLADGATDFNQTLTVVNSGLGFRIGTLSCGATVTFNGRKYTLDLRDDDLVLSIEAVEPAISQYVYLDFDGEDGVQYRNRDLGLSLTLSVQDPGFSEEQRQAVLSELRENYKEDGIVFTLERPADGEYSTLYFGRSEAFEEYGDFYGVSETHDGNNRNKSDCAYILLDQSYSDGQIVSVASHMLDHLLGYSYMADGTPDLKKYAESTYLLSTEWSQGDPYNKYCPVDPDTGKRCVTGCTNTAAAQIIHYWIETGLLDFTLTLEDSDAYTKNNITIDGSANPGAGHLSFTKTNKLLADYKTGSSDCIAALCFAAGVVQQANYSSDATSTPWKVRLFQRSGFANGIENVFGCIHRGRRISIVP